MLLRDENKSCFELIKISKLAFEPLYLNCLNKLIDYNGTFRAANHIIFLLIKFCCC